MKNTVCVVGAACSIKGTNLGEEIDSHDVVMRVNNHSLIGHEADVGSKYSILCVCLLDENLHTHIKYNRANRLVGIVPLRIGPFEVPISGGIDELWLYAHLMRFTTKRVSSNDAILTTLRSGLNDILSELNRPLTIFSNPSWVVCPDNIILSDPEYLRQQPPLLADQTIIRPSTGFMAIIQAIYRWGSASIAGFGYRESVHLGYYDKKFTSSQLASRINNTPHNYEAERLFINKLEEKGLVKRLDGS